HRIHFGRLLDGYAERDNLTGAGLLKIVGFSNSVLDFSEVLLPQDIRNCATCHTDSGAVCSASAPCGVGQECYGGKCRNRAWVQPSARVCLSCHDSAPANAHAAIMTWTDAKGNAVESCEVCHGTDGDSGVVKMHNHAGPI